MPIGYFEKFPTINYQGLDCTDITRRVKLDEALRLSYQAFYPYDVENGLRPDHIADAYYEDPTLDWMIFLSTEIVDPYYGWPLDDQLFDRFIEDKYGSIEIAQQKIRHYQIDWDTDTKTLTPTYWSSLPDPLKKYYNAFFGDRGQITFYQRKEQDYKVNTNKIVRFDITLNSSNSFSNSEFVDFKHSGEIIGTAEIIQANDTVIYVKNVTGNTDANSTYQIDLIGETTLANGSSVESRTVVQNISNDEFAYWSSVSYYDYEKEINEQRKTIIALQPRYLPNAIEEMKLKLLDE